MKNEVTHLVGKMLGEPKDAVHKCLTIVRLSDGSHVLRFNTLWKEGEEAVETDLRLSQESTELLFVTLQEIMMNREDYRFVEDTI